MTTEREDLYRCRLPEGLQVPLLVQLTEVDDGIPLEAEIELSVQDLKEGRADRLLGMREEDPKVYLKEAKRKKDPVSR